MCVYGVYMHACHDTYVERREQFSPLIMWGAGIKLKIVRLTICLYHQAISLAHVLLFPYSSWGQIHVLKHHNQKTTSQSLGFSF